MNYAQAEALRRFIGESWETYMSAISEDPAERLNLPVTSARWNPKTQQGKSFVHASSLDGCPKKPALEQHVKLAPRPNVSWLQRASAGTLMGNLFAEAMIWSTSGRTERECQFADNKTRLCGQVDVVIDTDRWPRIPVECKLTSAWRYKYDERQGLTLGYVLQCIAYMKLLPNKPEYGFVFTVFDDTAAPVPYRVHMIHRRGIGYEILDEHGEAQSLDASEFPSVAGLTFIKDADVNQRIADRVTWLDAQIEDEENPYPGPWQWPCATVSRAKGVLTLKPACAAFEMCHATTLRAAGYDPRALPKEIYGHVDPEGYIEMETNDEF